MSEKIGRFIILKHLGSGVSGSVVAVNDPSNGQVYAVKTMLSNGGCSAILKEFEMMLNKNFIDPFLLRYYCLNSEREITRIFMEYCEKGDLVQYVKENDSNIDEKGLLNIFGQITKGISVLHNNKIIHRDIKPQNILLNGKHEVKLADFGVAKMNNGTMSSQITIHGTHGFISSEVIKGKLQSFASDIFAFGCTMYFVATGILPFDGGTPFKTQCLILAGKYVPIERKDLSFELKNLIHKMMDLDEIKRPTIAQLLTHPVLHATISALPPRTPVPPSPVLLGSVDSANASTDLSKYPNPNTEIDADVAEFIEMTAAHNPTYTAADFRREFEDAIGRKASVREINQFLKNKTLKTPPSASADVTYSAPKRIYSNSRLSSDNNPTSEKNCPPKPMSNVDSQPSSNPLHSSGKDLSTPTSILTFTPTSILTSTLTSTPTSIPTKTEEKPVCEYDVRCTRKNPDHFKEYSHPKKDAYEKKYPSIVQSQTGDIFGEKPFNDKQKKPDLSCRKSDTNPVVDYRPICMYGEACYQTNPKHLKDFQHPNPSAGWGNPTPSEPAQKAPSAAKQISLYFDAPVINPQPFSASRDTKAEANEWNRLEKEQLELLGQQNQPQQSGQKQGDYDDEEEVEILVDNEEVFELLARLQTQCEDKGWKVIVDDVVLPVKGALEQLLSVLGNSAALYYIGDENKLWTGHVLREQKPVEMYITGWALDVLVYIASAIFCNDDAMPFEKRLEVQEKMKRINGFKFLYSLFFMPHEVKAKSSTKPFVMMHELPLNVNMSWKTKAAIVLALFHTQLPLPLEMSPVVRMLGHSLRMTMAKLISFDGSASAGEGTGAGGVNAMVVDVTNLRLLRILKAVTSLAEHPDNHAVLVEMYGKGGAGITLPALFGLLDPRTMPSEEAAVSASELVRILTDSKLLDIRNKAIGFILQSRPSERDNWSLLALVFQHFCDQPDPTQPKGGSSGGGDGDSDDSSVTRVVFNLCVALRNVLARNSVVVERFLMGVTSPVNGGKHMLNHKLLLLVLEKAFALSPIPTNTAMVSEEQALYVGIAQRCVACFVECSLCGGSETRELTVGTNLIRDMNILIKHCTSRLASHWKTKEDMALTAMVVQLTYNILALNDNTYRDAFGIDAVVNLAQIHDSRTSTSASGNLMGLYTAVSSTLLLRGISVEPAQQKPYNAAIETVIKAEAELKASKSKTESKGVEYLKLCQQAGMALNGLGGKWDVLKKRK